MRIFFDLLGDDIHGFLIGYIGEAVVFFISGLLLFSYSPHVFQEYFCQSSAPGTNIYD
ncbi:hypothetical protein DSUL_50303 [Desulfovibrionales bacterium]